MEDSCPQKFCSPKVKENLANHEIKSSNFWALYMVRHFYDKVSIHNLLKL